jgi:hypothetical protein
MEREHDFSELDALDYLDEKHSSLKWVSCLVSCGWIITKGKYRAIALQLSTLCTEIDNSWRKSRQPPLVPNSVVSSSFGVDSLPTLGNMNLDSSPQEASRDGYEPQYEQHYYGDLAGHQGSVQESPASEEASQDQANKLLNSLSKRGKVRYTCPHQERCRKGGVHRDGRLVVLERNSAFKSVSFLLVYLSHYRQSKTHQLSELICKSMKSRTSVIFQGVGIGRDLLGMTNFWEIRK